MKKIGNVATVFLFIILVLPTSTPAADKQQFCNNYADIAVGQYTLGKENHLPGIVPPQWSDNRSGHYSWCMQVPESFANSETAKRRAHLDQYLPNMSSAKKVPEGQKVGSAVKSGVSTVAATPISIPRPIKAKTTIANVSKAEYISLRDIEKAALISADKNKVQVKMHYRVEPAVADNLYAGAFLYDAKLNAINAGYTPTRPQNSPEGDFDITLTLPKEPFRAATIQMFLIQSGKILVKRYFKCPLVWDGTTARRIIHPTAKMVTGTVQTVQGQSAFSQLSESGAIQTAPIGNGSPIAFDPGLGP